MGLEVATLIHQLDPNNPVGATDQKSQGDDHLRMMKQCLLNTFANIDGAVTASHTELNKLTGATPSTAEINKLSGLTPTTAELNFVDGVTSNIQAQLDSKTTFGGVIASGTYTPIGTIINNLSSLSDLSARYIRIGNIVHVSGRALIDPVATGVTSFRITLPVASDFTADNHCDGVVASASSNAGGQVHADTVNNQAQISILEVATGGHFIGYEFTYQIL